MVVRAKWLLQKTPWPGNLIFFVLAFLYFWLVVEPHLIYHCFGTILPDAPQFATGWAFLRDSLATPGGPVVYVSGLLSLGYSSAWLGAGPAGAAADSCDCSLLSSIIFVTSSLSTRLSMCWKGATGVPTSGCAAWSHRSIDWPSSWPVCSASRGRTGAR